MHARQRLDLIHDHRDYAGALEVVRRLSDAGAQTLFAGGCVRDALLKRAPKDLDLATSAHPDVVQSQFERTIDVGKEFGTIIVIHQGRQIEVTTFRREGGYRDGRRPTHVEFTDAREDASRRDFTVNAIFYDPQQFAILDFENGRADLARKVLTTVGDPERRFAEDRLRVLRAVRFVAQLGFTLDPKTARAVRTASPALGQVAPERVLAELKRLLTADHRELGLRTGAEYGVWPVVWPEVNLTYAGVPFTSWENAFAALTWDAGGTRADARLSQWRAPNESRRRVAQQRRAVELLLDPATTTGARLRALGGPWSSDVRRLASVLIPSIKLAPDLARLDEITTGDGKLPRPWLDGADLRRLGFKPGAHLGRVLIQAYDLQLEGQLSARDAAEAFARERLIE